MNFLDVPDLLALGRTVLSARQLLDRSPHIWDNAFKSANLQPVPDDLLRYQYAALVYDHHCHVRSDECQCHVDEGADP
jgi:hypothetical protein